MSGGMDAKGFPPDWGAVRGSGPDSMAGRVSGPRRFFGRGGLAVRACGTIAALSVAGCAWFGDEEAAAPPDETGRALARSAAIAAAAFGDLAAVEAARFPSAAPPSLPERLPAALAARVELSWTGPLEGATALLAARAGYAHEVVGAAPARAVTVALAGGPRRAIEWLREAGWQAGRRALVEVDARRRRVRVVYPPRGGGS